MLNNPLGAIFKSAQVPLQQRKAHHMKKLIGVITLSFLFIFAERRMTMAEGRQFIVPPRLRKFGKTSRRNHGYPVFESLILEFLDEMPVPTRISAVHEKFFPRNSSSSGVPAGNQSTHPFWIFFRRK